MRKKFVLSLGSGGLRGFVHLGVYKALHENNIKIDAIYGTSVGSLVGAFISEGIEPDALIRRSKEISPLDVFDITIPRNGYIPGRKLASYLKTQLEAKNIEDLPIPLTVVATRVRTGEVEYFQEGPLAECILASCSIPNVFKPVVIHGVEYLDGDLCSPVAIKKARVDYQNAAILAVNIIPDATRADRSSLKWASLISRTIYRQTLVNHERGYADFFLNPVLGYGVSFSKKDALKRIEIGYRETIAIIPKLKQFLAGV